jgi:glutamate racemase
LVLGCTHYPLLHNAIRRFAGDGIALVDSADNCALAVRDLLQNRSLESGTGSGRLQVAVTDATGSFLQVAERALGLRVGEVLQRTVQPLVPTGEPASRI